jgi:hypothetical protein
LTGAIGGAAGGFAASAVLALLAFLFRRKKKESVEDEPETETITRSDSPEGYISESGLSEGVAPCEIEEEAGDVPRAANDITNMSDDEGASEHNLEEMNGESDGNK